MGKDEDLQKNVQDAIKLNPLLNTEEIEVMAKEGVITLTGFADSNAKKIEAEAAVKKIAGVIAVIEKIEIRSGNIPQKDDNEMTNEVIDVLKSNLEGHNDKIKVKVEVGKAILEGDLQWHYQKNAVKGPTNQHFTLKNKTNKIVKTSEINDENEKKEIEFALLRNWSIDDENVLVRVIENRVTLKGTVHSLYQKDEIERIASNTPGVSSVNNELVIEYE